MNKQQKQIISELWDNLRWLIICVIWIPKETRGILEDQWFKILKFDLNYKSFLLRASMNPKQKKYGEKYTKTQHKQFKVNGKENLWSNERKSTFVQWKTYKDVCSFLIRNNEC